MFIHIFLRSLTLPYLQTFTFISFLFSNALLKFARSLFKVFPFLVSSFPSSIQICTCFVVSFSGAFATSIAALSSVTLFLILYILSLLFTFYYSPLYCLKVWKYEIENIQYIDYHLWVSLLEEITKFIQK